MEETCHGQAEEYGMICVVVETATLEVIGWVASLLALLLSVHDWTADWYRDNIQLSRVALHFFFFFSSTACIMN